VPWFWSDQYNLKLQSVGLSAGHDQVVIRAPTKEDSFIAFYLRKGCMIAADCVNAVAEFTQAKRLITGKIAVTAAALADPDTDLKSLVTSPP
jgi:3-phenylpropionate/trans-cinnamate dioxygenase ferredoxin reductase subunit